MRLLKSPEFWNARWTGCGLLGLLTLVFFGDVLFGANDRVLSLLGTDIYRQFAGWRFFGFEQIRQGNFPFWNPLVYGGMPYFSGFQSALLYPPNWLHLLLPLEKAINWGIALHVWLVGAGMFLWMRSLGVRQVAALFSGTLLMFCAPHFLHIFAGHLTNLCVMAWAPWLFMAVSQWREEKKIHWVLLGAFFVAMEIFAGHPQYVYYGALITGFYAMLLLFKPIDGRWRFIIGFATIYMLAALLTAVQFVPGLEATGESIRGGGTGRVFAGSYSFPPENLLSLLVPGFFGNQVTVNYWGRWFYWEMLAFFSITGLWCALAGAIWDKRARLLAIASMFTIVLAFGSYTPLFDVMYALVPGYDLFRGNSKFMFFAILLAIAVAGMGLDRFLAKEELKREKILLACGAAGVLVCVLAAITAGAWGGSGEGGFWAGLRRWIFETREVTHLQEDAYFGSELATAAAANISRGFWIAAILLLIATALTAVRRRWTFAVYGLVLLGIVEVVAFGARHRKSFKLSHRLPSYQIEFRAANEGDFRVIDFTQTNGGMLSGLPDLWGDDPGVLKRYAEFIGLTQGVHPDEVNQHLRIRKTSKAFELLRLRHIFVPSPEGTAHQTFASNALRRFELVPGHEVLPERDALLRRLFLPEFDPRVTVLLEEAPNVVLPPGAAPVSGSWTIEREDTDEVIVRISTQQPCILLMSDPYSKGWQVENLSQQPPQAEYRLQPGNHILRAVPLEKGDHYLRIHYLPKTFPMAAAMSGWAILMWAFGLAWSLRQNRKAKRGT